MDLLLHNDGMYTAVLLPDPTNIIGIGGGACPQIPSIRPDVLNERLKGVLGFPQQVIDKIEKRLRADPDRETEIPITATPEQLTQLGFLGV